MRCLILALLGVFVAAPGWAGMQFEERPPAAPPKARPQPAPRPAPAPSRPQIQLPNDPNLIVDQRTRCAVWLPDPEPGETVQWSGPCANGLANGRGEMLRIQDGAVKYLYQGQFEQGRLTGRGTRIAANGQRLEAEFQNGQANGQGSLNFPDGVYEGEFRNDLPNGQGSRIWQDTRPWRRYDGEFRDGQRHGTGRMDYGNGIAYAGEWRDDRRNGTGIMDYGNGTRYEGTWRNDQRDGRGTYQWSINGLSGLYEGEWRNDQRNGRGTEVFISQNARIDGQYVDDRAEGRGFYFQGDRRFEGEIRNGCLRTDRGVIMQILAGANCR